MPKGRDYSLRNPPASKITGKKSGAKGKKKVTMKKVKKSTARKGLDGEHNSIASY